MVICLGRDADLHMPSWCHCHSLSLAPVNPDWFYLSGTSSPGSPGHSLWSRKTVVVVVVVVLWLTGIREPTYSIWSFKELEDKEDEVQKLDSLTWMNGTKFSCGWMPCLKDVVASFLHTAVSVIEVLTLLVCMCGAEYHHPCDRMVLLAMKRLLKTFLFGT